MKPLYERVNVFFRFFFFNNAARIYNEANDGNNSDNSVSGIHGNELEPEDTENADHVQEKD